MKSMTESHSPIAALKDRLAKRDPGFWLQLRQVTTQSTSPDELLLLSSMRKKAKSALGTTLPWKMQNLRIALLGGYTLYPLQEMIAQHAFVAGFECEFFIGNFDHYHAEILDEKSDLYSFRPEVVFLFPAEKRYQYPGPLNDPYEKLQAQLNTFAAEILQLCATVHQRLKAEVILSNFKLTSDFDPGPFRTKTLASSWNFLKNLNSQIGLRSPEYVHICDTEFLSCRRGTLASSDSRLWYESRQAGSMALLVDIAREVAVILQSLRASPKKVLAVDLDNTLWGGIIGDDGLSGIEIGDTAPRSEAFKDFQKYLLTLKKRGILFAVCSKNNPETALEPFEKHPDMVLKRNDFVAFKANWQPKPDNLRQIASELNLGLDSFVFIDDNPAEIAIVNQFLPEVSTIHLGEDPAQFIARVQEARFFEPRGLTAEDTLRTQQYQQEHERKKLQENATDMPAFLESLEMTAVFKEFNALDQTRIVQLINKSNQFNLTTKRRTDAEIKTLAENPHYIGFTARLADKFGDHGLISVIIGKIEGKTLEVDTWLMSCRVLARQMEEEALNELVRLAKQKKCTKIIGHYIITEKNALVRDHYRNLGFQTVSESPQGSSHELDLTKFSPRKTKINVTGRAYE